MRHATTITPDQQLALDEALRIAQDRHIVLIPLARTIKLWASGVKVQSSVRHAIMTNKKEVLKMLNMGDIRVCVNPSLHRASWDYFKGYYICGHCSRIDRYMRGLN